MRVIRWRILHAVVAALSIALVAPLPASAQASRGPGVTKAKPHPQVALVLSGGGARGGAHLGVLKVLEELRVPVDIIVGTSAGSIVGAAYASGLPLDEIEREMKGIATADLFRDVAREDAPYRRKADDAYNYIGPEVGYSRRGLSLPKGAVAGVTLEAVLRRLTRHQTSTDFDQLPIRFRAVATDIGTAEMVVIGSGQLALAARASMAIPGAVTPVEMDGRLLVDGGLKRNLPVDVARAMGADVVIAVNIGTPLLEPDQVRSLLTVTDQVLRIITEENVMQSVRELTPRDVLITPDLTEINAAAFDRLPDAARQGELAARAAADQLARYSLPEGAYAARRAARLKVASEAAGRRIDAVRIVGTDAVNPDVVLAAMDTTAGSDYLPERIDRDLKRIYSRGDFESVNYTLVDEPGTGRVLLVEVTEKSWGPHYLRGGLTLSSSFEGNAFFNLQASHRATWLNTLGAEWRTDLQLGHTGLVRTEWYQPLTTAQRWFVAPRLEARDEPFEVYDDDTGLRLARFRRQTHEIGVDVGVPLGTAGEARLGLVRGRLRFDDDTSVVPASLLGADAELGGVLALVRIDKLDNLRFPRSGYAGELRVLASHTRLGASDTYTKAELSLQGAAHTGPHTLRVAVRAGGNLREGPLPDHELLQLGGFLQLSGYQNGQLLGREMRFGRLVYSHRIARPGFFDGMYVGASAELGRIGDTVAGPERSRLRRGSSLYFALDTPLGPLYLAYGVGDGGNRSAYVFLGLP